MKKLETMKAKLEYVAYPTGNRFLNFWNSWTGDDVVCEVVDGKLILNEYDENMVLKETEITFQEFLNLVEQKFNHGMQNL